MLSVDTLCRLSVGIVCRDDQRQCCARCPVVGFVNSIGVCVCADLVDWMKSIWRNAPSFVHPLFSIALEYSHRHRVHAIWDMLTSELRYVWSCGQNKHTHSTTPNYLPVQPYYLLLTGSGDEEKARAVT